MVTTISRRIIRTVGKKNEHSFFDKLISAVIFIVVAIWLYSPVKKYWDEHVEEVANYENTKSNSRHLKIDELPGGMGVYLIIYKGDTVGVVAIKD